MRRGFGIAEIVLALATLSLAVMVFLTAFSRSNQQSLQSRNRTGAILLANSLMDEIEAHPYGAPQPLSWAPGVQKPATVMVHGNPQQMDFRQELTYLNGSFVGKTNDTHDVVTITLKWKEGIGNDQTDHSTPENKQLVVSVPVWR